MARFHRAQNSRGLLAVMGEANNGFCSTPKMILRTFMT